MTAVLIIVTLSCVAFAISSLKKIKNAESEFQGKKATLIKDNLDLKEKLSSLQEMVNTKTTSMNAFEEEKKTLQIQLNQLKAENDQLLSLYSKQLEEGVKKNANLKNKINAFENSPLLQRIKEAMAKEKDDKIKKILEEAMNNIELAQTGKAVELEPIVVTKKTATATPSSQAQQAAVFVQPEEKKGVILSFDHQNSLIVVNLGAKDNIKEGDYLRVYIGEQEVARAEVMSVRYRVAAAFIDDVNYRYTINDIKEGYKVTLLKRD